MNNSAIHIQDLHFDYGRTTVLRGVNLDVPEGSIFGFLGVNGAGKSTTIKILLGLLAPSSGSCSVLGLDPVREPLAVRAAVGYMAEDQRMYGWMTVQEIIRWVGEFYPAWDDQLATRLTDLMELPRKSKVKTLSKGQNSRLALLLALGHHPKLVILDDPTLGLDPIARKSFLRNVITLLQSNNVTVFFSSHLLYEIEPVADHIAILDKGAIVKTAKTDELRDSVRRFIFQPKDHSAVSRVSGILDASRLGESVSIVVDRRGPDTGTSIRTLSVNGVQESALNLDEIFEAYVIGNRGRVGQEVPAHA